MNPLSLADWQKVYDRACTAGLSDMFKNDIRLIDSHVHLGFENYQTDFDDICQRAEKFAVEKMVMIGPGDGMESNERAMRLVDHDAGRYHTMGLHPHNADMWNADNKQQLKDWLQSCRPVALGEMGLDFYYDYAKVDNQKRCFEEQLEWAALEKLPFIVHTRQAHKETLGYLKNVEAHIRKVGGLIHCFSEGPNEAEAYLALGMKISFSGVVSFKKAEAVRQAAKQTPLESMLVETDGPFLSPHPYRGKRNEPALVFWTALAIAELQNVSVSQVAKITTCNCKSFFNLEH